MSPTNLKRFLAASEFIDWDHPSIVATAKMLKTSNETEAARACFEYVRDEIRHSWDAQDSVVTLKASEVLAEKTGYCYAKSHLLAALLRANNIPAALCYQRLSLDGGGAPFCLHGLNAVWLPDYGWYRIDARGNKVGINAQFNPPEEQLAFQLVERGECDIEGYFSMPLNQVVVALQSCSTVQELYHRLPDVEPVNKLIEFSSQ